MASFQRFCLLLLVVSLLLTGCYNRPVRHLVSDVSLIRVNHSTREDVLVYLGEPDGQRMVSANLEEWVYIEEKESLYQKAPMVGKVFSADGYGKIVVTMEGDLVVGCRYSAYEKDELDWTDDFSWQKKNK